MRGDQLTWHWEVPDSHPFARQIDFAFREGFAGSDAPKFESDAAQDAYDVGVRARAELGDESRRFRALRVHLTGDSLGYELTERDR